MEIIGLRTQNITFNARLDQRQYRLSNQQSVGIPEDNLIVGFSLRFNYEGTARKSINGRPLININALVSSSLNLRGWGTETYLADTNLFNFVNVPDFFNTVEFNDFSPYQPFIKPIQAKKISWTKSSIAISREAASVSISDTQDFEIIVYHCSPDFKQFEKLLPPVTQIYSGQQLKVHYQNTIQINVPSAAEAPNVATIPLTFDGKSGIDSNAIIYGIRVMQIYYQTYDGKRQPVQDVFGSAFFNLKKADTIIFDKIPVLNICPQRNLYLPYLEIEPIPAYLLDWQGSNVYISDNSTSVTDTAFLIQFFYHFQSDIVENVNV